MAKPSKDTRLERPIEEMVQALRNQLALLEQYVNKAFDDKKPEYLAEVATKLRVLLVRSRNNKPLLFEVANRLGTTLLVRLNFPPEIEMWPDGPKGGETITFEKYLDLPNEAVRTSKGLEQITGTRLIRTWAEQLGGAHEDWELDESVVRTTRGYILINTPRGLENTSQYFLGHIARQTLKQGQRLLAIASRTAALQRSPP